MNDSTPQRIRKTRDLESPPWFYLLWGVPGVMVFAISAAFSANILPLTFAGILWTTAVAWMGVGCFINGLRCGRVHCRIDGVLFPLLSVAGALNALRVISFSWNAFLGVFLLILIASFVPEWTWGKYS